MIRAVHVPTQKAAPSSARVADRAAIVLAATVGLIVQQPCLLSRLVSQAKAWMPLSRMNCNRLRATMGLLSVASALAMVAAVGLLEARVVKVPPAARAALARAPAATLATATVAVHRAAKVKVGVPLPRAEMRPVAPNLTR